MKQRPPLGRREFLVLMVLFLAVPFVLCCGCITCATVLPPYQQQPAEEPPRE